MAGLSDAEVAAIAEARITEGEPCDLADVPYLLAGRRIVQATGAASVWRDADEDREWDIAVVLPDDVEPRRWTPVTLWRLIEDLGIGTRVLAIRASTFEVDRDRANGVARGIALYGRRLA